jgi:hypothetical protein
VCGCVPGWWPATGVTGALAMCAEAAGSSGLLGRVRAGSSCQPRTRARRPPKIGTRCFLIRSHRFLYICARQRVLCDGGGVCGWVWRGAAALCMAMQRRAPLPSHAAQVPGGRARMPGGAAHLARRVRWPHAACAAVLCVCVWDRGQVGFVTVTLIAASVRRHARCRQTPRIPLRRLTMRRPKTQRPRCQRQRTLLAKRPRPRAGRCLHTWQPGSGRGR